MGTPRREFLPAPYDLVWSGMSLIFFAGGLLYPSVTAATGARLPACAFKSMTEVPCAGCGSGRSLVAFSHGGFLESIAMNPLFAALCFFSLAVIVYTLVVRLSGVPRLRLSRIPSGGWVYPVAVPALILANWAFLIIAGR